ncbi:K homology domain, prokaryotic type [Artemisia annua]|uniref:K homology domain, prokaryotic type n=1 Tax=Artemisia annua TaxID=35608 RepID=A0A2U1NTR9_ARTAN|nr:K homology domain, prokaryotic type [Artemisia annua]
MATNLSKKRKFVADGVFFAELNEVLTRELAEDGYSGVEVRVTPMRTEIIIRATRTQNVLVWSFTLNELTTEGSVPLLRLSLCDTSFLEGLLSQVIVSGKLRAQRAKPIKFKDVYMVSTRKGIHLRSCKTRALRQDDIIVHPPKEVEKYRPPLVLADEPIPMPFPENSVELYAERVNNRGLCAIAQAESLRDKLLGGLAVRRFVIVSGKLRAQRAKSIKFKDVYMVSSGQPVKEYIDAADDIIVRPPKEVEKYRPPLVLADEPIPMPVPV